MKKKPDIVIPAPLSNGEVFRQDVLDLIKKQGELMEAVLDEYAVELMLGGDVVTELRAGNEKLFNEVAFLDIPEEEKPEINMDTLLKQLDEVEPDGNDAQGVLDKLSDEDIWDWVRGKGYTCIEVNRLDLQMKLEEFINTEIYPYYSDQLKMVV